MYKDGWIQKSSSCKYQPCSRSNHSSLWPALERTPAFFATEETNNQQSCSGASADFTSWSLTGIHICRHYSFLVPTLTPSKARDPHQQPVQASSTVQVLDISLDPKGWPCTAICTLGASPPVVHLWILPLASTDIYKPRIISYSHGSTDSQVHHSCLWAWIWYYFQSLDCNTELACS